MVKAIQEILNKIISLFYYGLSVYPWSACVVRQSTCVLVGQHLALESFNTFLHREEWRVACSQATLSLAQELTWVCATQCMFS